MDFVYSGKGGEIIAIECKWSERDFSPRNLKIFSKRYPEAECLAVCGDVDSSHTRNIGGLKIRFIGLGHLVTLIESSHTGRKP